MWGPPPGLGFFRTRRHDDAGLFLQEYQHNARRTGRQPGRRVRLTSTGAFVTVIIVLIIADIIWG